MGSQGIPPERGRGEIDELIARQRLTRRGFLQGAALLGAGAALGPLAAACGSGSTGGATSASPAAATPKKGGHIRSAIGGGSAADTLDPQVAGTEAASVATWEMFDALMDWDPTHKLVMQLAESYEPNADGTVHTVKLKSGLTFHDGKPVSADDVVYSFKRILDPKTAASGATTLTDLKPSGVKKLDPLTVQFTLERPNVIFYEALAYYGNAIVQEGYENTGPQDAIGTGAWKLTSFRPGQQVEFAANPDYWGEGPYAEQLTLIEFADPTAKLNALLGGTADHMTRLDGAQVSTVEGTPGFKVLEAKTGSWNPFTMRVDQKPFDDARVRQAFRLIVDRQQMIDQAKGGYGWLGNDVYAPFDPGYPKELPQRAQDLEQAKSLLKQAGYDNNLTVELVCSTATGAGDVQAAQVFAEQAKGAGVTVKVNKVDPGVFYGDQYTKWTFAMDFWAIANYLNTAQLASMPDAIWNETHWDDAEWLAIVTEAFKTVDEAKRNELVAQAATIDHERGGYIIYAFNNMLDAYSDKLAGLVPDNWGGVSACRNRYNLMHFV